MLARALTAWHSSQELPLLVAENLPCTRSVPRDRGMRLVDLKIVKRPVKRGASTEYGWLDLPPIKRHNPLEARSQRSGCVHACMRACLSAYHAGTARKSGVWVLVVGRGVIPFAETGEDLFL